MSALDDLSPIARHALWVACMDAGVPVQLAEPVTISRVTALLRNSSQSSKARAVIARAPLFSDTNSSEGTCQLPPNGSLMGSDPL